MAWHGGKEAPRSAQTSALMMLKKMFFGQRSGQIEVVIAPPLLTVAKID
jgi:hypothetical protein